MGKANEERLFAEIEAARERLILLVLRDVRILMLTFAIGLVTIAGCATLLIVSAFR